MSDVIQFVPKAELERIQFIREARAIYESVFPTAVGEPGASMAGTLVDAAGDDIKR
jgi:hypothetical protein